MKEQTQTYTMNSNFKLMKLLTQFYLTISLFFLATSYMTGQENNIGLSKTEQHLAGLLRMNLSTKDIALLKNITPGSVRLSKHRLRKKLDLPEGKELEHFLQEI